MSLRHCDKRLIQPALVKNLHYWSFLYSFQSHSGDNAQPAGDDIWMDQKNVRFVWKQFARISCRRLDLWRTNCRLDEAVSYRRQDVAPETMYQPLAFVHFVFYWWKNQLQTTSPATYSHSPRPTASGEHSRSEVVIKSWSRYGAGKTNILPALCN